MLLLLKLTVGVFTKATVPLVYVVLFVVDLYNLRDENGSELLTLLPFIAILIDSNVGAVPLTVITKLYTA